jgi:hypothetical protein
VTAHLTLWDMFASRGRIDPADKHAWDEAARALGLQGCRSIMMHPPAPAGDITELSEIHRGMFSLVYPDAGQVVSVSGKGQRSAALDTALRNPRDDNWQNLDRTGVARRLAHHLTALLPDAGPFKLASDHAKRMLLTLKAERAGWNIHWEMAYERVPLLADPEHSAAPDQQRASGQLDTLLEGVLQRHQRGAPRSMHLRLQASIFGWGPGPDLRILTAYGYPGMERLRLPGPDSDRSTGLKSWLSSSVARLGAPAPWHRDHGADPGGRADGRASAGVPSRQQSRRGHGSRQGPARGGPGNRAVAATGRGRLDALLLTLVRAAARRPSPAAGVMAGVRHDTCVREAG